MTDKKLLWYLRKLPILQGFDSEVVQQIADAATLRDIRRKEVLYLPGDPGETVYFVHGGRIKTSKVSRDGKSLTLSYHGPTELFGELCLGTGTVRAEMAEAVETAIVSEFARQDFEALCLSQPRLAVAVTHIVIARRRELEAKLESLVFRDVGSKLAELLLRLSDEYGVDDARGTLLSVKITHQEIANMIGATRETVSLMLSQFKRQNLIETDGRRVIVADSPGLRALC